MSVRRRFPVSALVVASCAGAVLAASQVQRPLAPVPQNARVAPFFDGWYANPDGTVTLSFGYSNLNKTGVEIPIGPDNFVTPKEYDGRQPTSFPAPESSAGAAGGANVGVATAGPANNPSTPGGAAPAGNTPSAGGGGGGGGGQNYERERGVFTVTVPANFNGDVVWTLRYQGQTWTVPGRAKSGAYQLSWPMAMGSTPPLVRFESGGRTGRGPAGIQAGNIQARAGAPVELALLATDDAVHEKEPIPVKREIVPSINVTWFKHAGPGGAAVTFTPPKMSLKEPQGKVSTTAMFPEPGEYTVRARVDTFGNIDSTAPDQCCWTNAYWKVSVSR